MSVCECVCLLSGMCVDLRKRAHDCDGACVHACMWLDYVWLYELSHQLRLLVGEYPDSSALDFRCRSLLYSGLGSVRVVVRGALLVALWPGTGALDANLARRGSLLM